MEIIRDLATLEALYEAPVANSVKKVVPALTPHYARWIGAARFCVLATVGPEGVDASPRGDIGPVVRIQDAKTLLLPDWRGNNRIDSLRNILRDGRASLMFMIPGAQNVVRVNGRALLSTEPALIAAFETEGKSPKCVIYFTIEEAYFQCAKAIMRSGLWGGQRPEGLPTAGDFLAEVDQAFDGAAYDASYPAYAKERMW